MVIFAIGVFITLYFVPAGYGQLFEKRKDFAINDKIGWIIMESPVVLFYFLLWVFSDRRFEIVPLVFFIIFNIHYLQRTFIFPFLLRGKHKMPVFQIIVPGIIFNTANAYIQGVWIFYLSPANIYSSAWLRTPQFIIGAILFFVGFFINIQSDSIIRNLRKPGDTNFYIPKGGMFKYVTSANYLGEFTEWVAWAIMTLSWSGLVFAIWTFSNLGPRAHSLRNWYRNKFGDEFPKHRKRMIPFIY